jgi:hypothetical protein
VSWKSKLQPTVATSTCEAEYMAAGEAVKEALWLRKLLPEFGEPLTTVKILGDNQAALAVTGNAVVSERTKHTDVSHHFTRERVELGEVCFKYCPTKDMLADILTKNATAKVFQPCVKAMGLKSVGHK